MDKNSSLRIFAFVLLQYGQPCWNLNLYKKQPQKYGCPRKNAARLAWHNRTKIMITHKAVRDLINRLAEKYGSGDYIFRGTPKRHSLKSKDGYRDGINSTLYRWAMKGGESEKIPGQQKLYRDAFTNNPYFSIARMEKEIVDKFSRRLKIKKSPLEILTDLQHFGGKTNMIDFSRNMHVALFFACQGDSDESGELIALHKSKLTQIEEVDYSQIYTELEVISPSNAQSSYQRVYFQSSVFVRPAKGYIDPKKCEIFRICGKFKAPLSEYLRALHDLTEERIYNDLHGFINNEKNNETATLYFNLGKASHEKGDHENALMYYNECVQRDHNHLEAHNSRGMVYTQMELFVLAIMDFSIVISIKPRLSLAYNNRGVVYNRMGQYNLAIADFDKAITYDPEDPKPYYGRGLAKEKTGDKESALADFTKAQKLGLVLPEGLLPPKK